MSTAITLEMHRTSVYLTAVKANRSQQGQATVSGRVISGSGILLKIGVGLGIWMLLRSEICPNRVRDMGERYEQKVGHGMWDFHKKGAGMQDQLPPPPSPPDPEATVMFSHN